MELPRGKPAFDQDPHRVREISERNLEAAIGREVRNFRRQQGMTVADLSAVTGLSIGMLSKDREWQHLAVTHDFAGIESCLFGACHELFQKLRRAARGRARESR